MTPDQTAEETEQSGEKIQIKASDGPTEVVITVPRKYGEGIGIGDSLFVDGVNKKVTVDSVELVEGEMLL